MTRLIAMAHEEENRTIGNVNSCTTTYPKTTLAPTTNKATPKPHGRDAGMALLKVMFSASAETARYLYEPLPVEKFK